MHEDLQDIAEILIQTFIEQVPPFLRETNAASVYEASYRTSLNNRSCFFLPTQNEVIKDDLKSLSKQSASGRDDKSMTDKLCIQDIVKLFLLKLLNKILKIGMYLLELETNPVIPIYKNF